MFFGGSSSASAARLETMWEGWSSVIVSQYMASVLWSSFSNMSKSLWLTLIHGSTYPPLPYTSINQSINRSTLFRILVVVVVVLLIMEEDAPPLRRAPRGALLHLHPSGYIILPCHSSQA